MAKIVIIDDDKSILEVTKIILEAENYKVEMIDSDRNIIEKVKKIMPDLILLDISMPGLGGKEICTKLKKETETEKIPIMMLSASSKIREVTKDCGADYWLEKPFEMDQLIDKVKQVLNRL